MKRKCKPPKLFEQIAAVGNQCSEMAKRFDEEDKIEIVLKKDPKDYTSMLANTEIKHDALCSCGA
eukprot:15292725-Ditylum_brightwellii.AAC.1